MPLPEVLKRTFLVHDSAPEGVWAVDAATLEVLFHRVDREFQTLETGAGLSTVLFALKETRHTCIVPAAIEVQRIKEYCTRSGIRCDRIDFVIDHSENALPRMRLSGLDLALIDGRHGFPAPMLDWHYIAPMLRIGGVLVIDDTQLWPVRVLRNFLAGDPAWKLDCDLARTAVFVKLADGSQGREWTDQPYVVQQTEQLALMTLRRARYLEAGKLLREGRVLALALKIGKLVRRVLT